MTTQYKTKLNFVSKLRKVMRTRIAIGLVTSLYAFLMYSFAVEGIGKHNHKTFKDNDATCYRKYTATTILLKE